MTVPYEKRKGLEVFSGIYSCEKRISIINVLTAKSCFIFNKHTKYYILFC